ncbi:MAG: flagellar biosynthetic protein FliQ [Longimicrobiales bacterium]|jgi:flagellar biosynthetic protein FliQ
MTYDLVVDISRQAIMTAFWLALPILGTALAVGLLVSIVQTVTQIQEQSVAFVLKLFAVGLITFALLPWMISQAVGFASRLIMTIPAMV